MKEGWGGGAGGGWGVANVWLDPMFCDDFIFLKGRYLYVLQTGGYEWRLFKLLLVLLLTIQGYLFANFTFLEYLL